MQSSLESLQLGGTGISGELPACLFGGQSKLYLLSARATRLGGTIPDAFATATRLQVLDLGYVRARAAAMTTRRGRAGPAPSWAARGGH
jgi:hypothetical protein